MRLTAVSTLGELLLDGVEEEEKEAADSPLSVIPAIVGRLGDVDEEVAQAAVFALGELREHMLPHTGLLAAQLRRPDPELRCRALDTLGALGDNASLEVGAVAGCLADPDTPVRPAALRRPPRRPAALARRCRPAVRDESSAAVLGPPHACRARGQHKVSGGPLGFHQNRPYY